MVFGFGIWYFGIWYLVLVLVFGNTIKLKDRRWDGKYSGRSWVLVFGIWFWYFGILVFGNTIKLKDGKYAGRSWGLGLGPASWF